ncbi:hypothetical protein AWU68_0807 [Corynebacterium simulans]|uniref:Uncharacterized protein n=1 Tax=Corynebacterium simulans TaxID=146827 RepID=A0ABR5VB76_9CORY|nr:hypothetical protein AWU68_0807 [Corynebacterium simulans]KXU18683.1 hypothetical protein WM41_0647 [Corynebacterium simulans]
MALAAVLGVGAAARGGSLRGALALRLGFANLSYRLAGAVRRHGVRRGNTPDTVAYEQREKETEGDKDIHATCIGLHRTLLSFSSHLWRVLRGMA